MPDLVIAPEKEGKGRSFTASLLCSIKADGLWSGGGATTDATRPVYFMIATGEEQIRPFVTNLQMGKKAIVPTSGYGRQKASFTLEVLRSAGYSWSYQKTADGTIATAYLADLFRLDPGMVDPDGIAFVLAPPTAWVERYPWDTRPAVDHVLKLGTKAQPEQLERLAPLAPLFCAYLDRRTRCPLLKDARFYLQLMVACLEAGIASVSEVERWHRPEGVEWMMHSRLGYQETDVESVGLVPGLAFKSYHESFEPVLAAQVERFRKAGVLPMARQASIAVAGYYPYPKHLIAPLARLIEPLGGGEHCVFDPCAGDGTAALILTDALFDLKNNYPRPLFYAAEMEATRADRLQKNVYDHHLGARDNVVCGNAFRLRLHQRDKQGATHLFLNPPYEPNREFGRMEEKFLVRFAPALRSGGVLIFVVPFYALADSADTIGREFENVSCFRFPGNDFAAFRQVVLLAVKRPGLTDPDPATAAKVRAWSADSSSIPELPFEGSPVVSVEPAPLHRAGFNHFDIAPMDLSAVRGQVRAWHQTGRDGRLVPVPGIFPEEGPADLLERRYPLAVPPKPAHIATGIAAGVFNGARIAPDDPSSGLPDLLVKGVFDKEWRKKEEKINKKGEVRAIVEVQEPKLRVTVLNLRTGLFHTLRPGVETTGADQVADFTTADLLGNYGKGLMDVLLAQCPVLHDPSRPEDNFPLPAFDRKLYAIQESATRAAVKLLGGVSASRQSRRGKAAILLGETGTGKSTATLATAKTIGARRVLVLCPPHVVAEWVGHHVPVVLPGVPVMRLADVGDVQRFAEDTTSPMAVAVLSREDAKLGHTFEGVTTGRCPRCDAPTPFEADDLAKKRACCEAVTHRPVSGASRLAFRLACKLYPALPESPAIQRLFSGRHLRRRLAQLATVDGGEKARPAAWARVQNDAVFDETAVYLWNKLVEKEDANTESLQRALVLLFLANPEAGRLARFCVWGYADSILRSASPYGPGARARETVKELLLLLPRDQRLSLASELQGMGAQDATYWQATTWRDWARIEESLSTDGRDGLDSKGEWRGWRRVGEEILKGALRPGDPAGLSEVIDRLTRIGAWQKSAPCGEPLYQAVPEPRKMPLATYITRHHKNLFDFLVLDEGHEYATDGSAQERAAHRLTSMGAPTMLLSGSIMNGYAQSLFPNLWALLPSFREEFDRSDMQRFIDRYGFRKRQVEEKDLKTGEVVAFGTMSDRVEKTARLTGNAPGVLPLLVLKYLLRGAITMHKEDLAIDLPPCVEKQVLIQPSDEQRSRFTTLQTALVRQIKKDMWDPERVGKLWGQLSELPSYFDRASNDYEIRYPESVGSGLVASVGGLSPDELLPKEQWLVDLLRSERAEGRNVLVFSWHVELLPRLQRIVEKHAGEKGPVLDPGKVPTAKRIAWINKEVVGKDRHVMFVNPVAIQTGINNLTHFHTIVWMENPACNPLVYRQANGRIHRIGQTKATRVFSPVYDNTLPRALYQLLLHKVGVSLATDGLDSEAALEAAGVGDSNVMTGLSVGKQLYDILTREPRRQAA
jgi:hypothetical protein